MKIILIFLLSLITFKSFSQEKIPSDLVERLSKVISKHYEKEKKSYGKIEPIKPEKVESTIKIKPIYLKHKSNFNTFILEYYFFSEEEYRKGTGVYIKVTSLVKKRDVVKMKFAFTNPMVGVKYLTISDTIKYGESREYILNYLWLIELNNSRIPLIKVDYTGKRYKFYYNRLRRQTLFGKRTRRMIYN